MPVLKKHIENIRLLKSVAKKPYQKHFDELEKNYRELEIRYDTVENIARKLAGMRTAPETGLKRMREVVAKATKNSSITKQSTTKEDPIPHSWKGYAEQQVFQKDQKGCNGNLSETIHRSTCSRIYNSSSQ